MRRAAACRLSVGLLLAAALAGCNGSEAASRSGGPPPATTSPHTVPPSTAPAAGSTAEPSLSAPPTSAVAPPPPADPVPPKAPTTLAPVPAAAAEPATRFPVNAPAVGSGAHPTVGPVPDELWARMAGTSWTEGCPVGRAGLRAVTVNFWGFDGKRSRGTLVVATSIADRTAAAFSALYDQQFRIRSMRPMDSTWGQNPAGPGADDYAAMAADNTSGFNCRYVGGSEAKKVWSNHAYGTAIDINDWENPYVAMDGTVYPHPYFLSHRSGPGVFAGPGSAAVRAFSSRGFFWGGLWSHRDYQHFEVRR